MGQLHVSVGLYVAFLSGVGGMCGTDRQGSQKFIMGDILRQSCGDQRVCICVERNKATLTLTRCTGDKHAQHRRVDGTALYR